MPGFKESKDAPANQEEADKREQKLMDEALQQIDEGDWSILENPEMDHRKLILGLINSNRARTLVENFDKFGEVLDQKMALEISNNATPWAIAEYLEHFKISDYQKIL
ncbi:hypothetical protein K8R42_03525, partial [bacterium]|nr:hypothetical protein [bacterium]